MQAPHKRLFFFLYPLLITALLLSGCDRPEPSSESTQPTPPAATTDDNARPAQMAADFDPARLSIYAPFKLQANLDHLSQRQRQMLVKLIEASQIMDQLFWQQAWGDREALLESIDDVGLRRFADINYGPWDRLDGDRPFIRGVGAKPLGARFYPTDMSKAEFEAWDQTGKTGQYSLVRRDSNGELTLLPYHEAWAEPLQRAADGLREAAGLADNEAFAAYLRLRADAILNDDYLASDLAWMDMKDNPVELVYGPIESYEDQLYGYRAAYEAYVLIKDLEWSERLARFADYLPDLQRGLPVADAYKQETPGSDADLGAYDVIYYAGHSNAGSKTIAINLPNDERVQLQKGTRRLQLKNAMRAKFDQILVPIAAQLIDPSQRQHITFDAFFANTMFHEVAHGLGIKNTINNQGSVREALREHASWLEEGKADVLGLYMIEQLRKRGEISDGELLDNYVTFLASIFRSVRFGSSSAHGQANLVRFNFFREQGAFSRDADSGYYRIDPLRFAAASENLSRLILTIQGDGDHATATALLKDQGNIPADLQQDLERLAEQNIAVDIVFEQGIEAAGLSATATAAAQP